MKIETNEDNADFGIEHRRVSVCHSFVVFRDEIASYSGIGAADKRHIFVAEFLLNAGFAKDEDFAFVGGKFEDARDVD